MTTIPTPSHTERKSEAQRSNDSGGDDDVMMMEDEGNSITTTMGVFMGYGTSPRRSRPSSREYESVNGSVTGNSFVVSKHVVSSEGTGEGGGEMLLDNDDISTLTEYSMDEEDDDVSQTTANTAWTVVTTGTDSTTVPTRNFLPVDPSRQRMTKRPLLKEASLLRDNSQFKRRRRA
jgi:hypothetical protein